MREVHRASYGHMDCVVVFHKLHGECMRGGMYGTDNKLRVHRRSACVNGCGEVHRKEDFGRFLPRARSIARAMATWIVRLCFVNYIVSACMETFVTLLISLVCTGGLLVCMDVVKCTEKRTLTVPITTAVEGRFAMTS